MFHVARSGFYRWLSAPKSERKQRREELGKRIIYHFHDNKARYGAPRIKDCLVDEGKRVSEKLVGRIMRENGLHSCTVKKYKVQTTDSNHKQPIAGNLLNQQFKTTAPNKVWVTDITYLWTRQGRLYLACVMDLFSRKIVGWSLQSRMTNELVLEALDRAVAAEKPAPGLVHHTDRGSQYASEEYQERLRGYKMICSMSRKGNCYDNAVIEAFHANIKRELIYQEKFATKEIAQQEIYWYIEFFYNRKRKHSTLGYLSPIRFEEVYYARNSG
ncbi:IS3 family transposase [Paenibacillus sp. N3.4]|nr:IS3 family transposase [Paenibacillus sp. N3.4]